MKKLLFLTMLSVVAIFYSCKGDDPAPQPTITGYDKAELNQTIYADETSTASDFAFTAADKWYAVVESAVKASDTDWVTLNPASGGAGSVNMAISLGVNTTGQDRTATINIVCDHTTVKMTLKQKATTASGDVPQLLTEKKITKIITSGAASPSGDETTTTLIEYDDQNRVTKLTKVGDTYSNFTYNNDGFTMESFDTDGAKEAAHTITITKNSDGYVTKLNAQFDWMDWQRSGETQDVYTYTNNRLTATETTTTTYHNRDDDGDGVVDDVNKFEQTISHRFSWTGDNLTQYQLLNGNIVEDYTYTDIASNKYFDLNLAMLLPIVGEMSCSFNVIPFIPKGVTSANLVESMTNEVNDRVRFEYTLNSTTSLPETIDIYFTKGTEPTVEKKMMSMSLTYEE